MASYPIYFVEVRFVQDGEASPEERGRMKWWPNNPGPGRIWNSLSMYQMYRDDPGPTEVERWAREEWWPKNRDGERRMGGRIVDAHPSDERFTVKLTHRESWCCGWFDHYTFDVGQSDDETLASFQRYVDRHTYYQDWPHDDRSDAELAARGISYRVCLMGAEDPWRWSGGPGPNDRTVPPCRCEHCKAQGVIRIGH